MEVHISTQLKFGNILFGCFRQVGCLIEVTANSGLFVVLYCSTQHAYEPYERPPWSACTMCSDNFRGGVVKSTKLGRYR